MFVCMGPRAAPLCTGEDSVALAMSQFALQAKLSWDFLCMAMVHRRMHRGYGATAARLTPDQKVGSSNLSALSFLYL